MKWKCMKNTKLFSVSDHVTLLHWSPRMKTEPLKPFTGIATFSCGLLFSNATVTRLLRCLMDSVRWRKVHRWPDGHPVAVSNSSECVSVCVCPYVTFNGVAILLSEQHNLCQTSEALFNYNWKLESPVWEEGWRNDGGRGEFRWLRGRSHLRPKSGRPLFLLLTKQSYLVTWWEESELGGAAMAEFCVRF